MSLGDCFGGALSLPIFEQLVFIFERFGLCLPCLLPGRLPSPFLLRRLLSGEGGAGVEPMQNISTSLAADLGRVKLPRMSCLPRAVTLACQR